MKRRKSFISNSSSSSFIVIGFEIDEEINFRSIAESLSIVPEDMLNEWNNDSEMKDWQIQEEAQELVEAHLNIDVLYETDASSKQIFGITIAKGIEEECGGSISIEDITNATEKLKKIFPNVSDVKIFYGNENC